MPDTDTHEQRLITIDSVNGRPDGTSVLDLLEIPDDITAFTVLIGKDNPVTGDDALFVLFSEPTERELQRNMQWCHDADIVVELVGIMPDGDFDGLAREVQQRWPDATVYDYGCLCCGGTPMRYRH